MRQLSRIRTHWYFSSSWALQSPRVTLAFLITDAHSVLSKDFVLHICTSIFLKSNSVSPSHLNLGLHSFHPSAGLPFSMFLTLFYDIQIHALVIKIKENTNKCTILYEKVFTIKTSFYDKSTDMFWPFVCYPQRVYISICIKHRL